MTFTLKELFCKAKTEILFTALMSKQSLTCFVFYEIITWNLSACSVFLHANDFLNILCKYSLIKRMEIRFSALKNNLFLKTCVSKKGFRRRHKERKLFTFKVTKMRANEIYHLGTEICNIWFFYKYSLPFNWVLIVWVFVRRTSWSFSYPNKLMKWVVFLWLWNAKIKLPDLLLLNYLKLKCFYFFFFFDWCFSAVTFKLLKRNLRLKLISRKTFCLK